MRIAIRSRRQGTSGMLGLSTVPTGRSPCPTAGRRLIEAVYAFADDHDASGVYGLTQEYNSAARSLYDTIAHRSSFVVYQR